ncbi:MAG TPA: TIGR02757 family protein [Vicinamibacterales bacterium]|nr:TIGR02757 family protein [Vicinamibacterales bacterium]
MKVALDRLYAAFNVPDSAVDPIAIVRRYDRLEDREVVAFLAAGLAFGRVASVMASVEAACLLLGRSPAAFVRAFEPRRSRRLFDGFVHRWTRGDDLSAVILILRTLIDDRGSVEQAFADGLTGEAPDTGAAIEAFSTRARQVNVTPAYGRATSQPGAHYFFSRPSTGAACKRLNLFLRWMTRQDKVDPGGWTRVPRRQLVVPLDTHTIRVGRCLGLTRRTTPGWRMATDITAALRHIDPDDPVRYDFALCHLSMMGGCGFGAGRLVVDCPLQPHCRPRKRR